tara:strand:- start:808 stop:1245 length:438 start_codon:yes stop_codon:yes gene_type:complete
MKIEDIEGLWDNDSKIDPYDLDSESLKIPELHNKYWKLLNVEILSLKYLESQVTIQRKKLWAYYNGISIDENSNEVFNAKLKHKDDINAFIDGDEKYQEVKSKVLLQEQKVKYIEAIIKELSQRTWNIRNAIEWHKFKGGEPTKG